MCLPTKNNVINVKNIIFLIKKASLIIWAQDVAFQDWEDYIYIDPTIFITSGSINIEYNRILTNELLFFALNRVKNIGVYCI